MNTEIGFFSYEFFYKYNLLENLSNPDNYSNVRLLNGTADVDALHLKWHMATDG